MSLELAVLSGTFLALFAWFLEAMLRDQYLLTSLYVHLVDGKWRDTPGWVLKKADRAFSIVLGDPLWSARSVFMVAAYSTLVNLLISMVRFNIPSVTSIFEIITNEDEAFSSLERVHGFLGLLVMPVVVFSGIIHDIVSVYITRKLVKRAVSYHPLLILDFIVALALFFSTKVFLMSTFRAGIYALSTPNLHGPGEKILRRIGHFFEAFIQYYPRSLFADPRIDKMDTSFFLMAVSTLFPTLAYCLVLGLSICFYIVAALFGPVATNAISTLSRVRPGRIAFWGTGLGAFTAFLSALIGVVQSGNGG